MPSSLVNRYAVYVQVRGKGPVRRPIARDPSLLVAVESCLAAYRATGHLSYVIEDQRKHRAFLVDRGVLLQVLYLKTHDRTRYFQILNRVDRSGGEEDLKSFLAKHAQI